MATHVLDGKSCSIGMRNCRHPFQCPINSIIQMRLNIRINMPATLRNWHKTAALRHTHRLQKCNVKFNINNIVITIIYGWRRKVFGTCGILSLLRPIQCEVHVKDALLTERLRASLIGQHLAGDVRAWSHEDAKCLVMCFTFQYFIVDFTDKTQRDFKMKTKKNQSAN